jgi:hypothetical protein
MGDREINWRAVAQEAEKVRDLALTNQEAAILGRVAADKERDLLRSEAVIRQREHASLLAEANAARAKAEQERDAIRTVANGAISKLCDAACALHTGLQWDDELQSRHGSQSDYLMDRHNSARHALGYLRAVMQKIEQKPKVVQDEQAAQHPNTKPASAGEG